MKAVVLEIRDGYAAVLCEDGTVQKLRRRCKVGETIELGAEKSRITSLPKRAVRWAAAAAAAIILVSGGAYGYNNVYAYSYVTLDANPSIEYVLNRRNRVLSVEALNDDAEELVRELTETVRSADITDAIERTTELLYEESYLGEDRDNCLIVSVSSRGEPQREKLTEELGAFFSEPGREEFTVYMTEATRDEAARAGSLGMSAGKYKLIEDIAGAAPSESEAGRMGAESVGELMTERGLLPERREKPTAQQQNTAPTEVAAPEAEAEPGSGEPAKPDGRVPEPEERQAARSQQPAQGGEPAQPRQEDGAQSVMQGGTPQGGMSPSGEPSN